MRSLESYLEEYSESHQNPTNILIHKFCVPTILFSILGILKALPVPVTWPLWIDWNTVFIAASLVYYGLFKNVRVVLAIIVMIVPMLLILEALRPRFFVLSVTVFMVAWVGQFIGHKIEGKKPSFFKDIFFLLIGPVWTMNSLASETGVDLKIRNT